MFNLSFWQDVRGSVVLPVAVLTPVLLLAVLGSYEFGKVIMIRTAMQAAADAGALSAAASDPSSSEAARRVARSYVDANLRQRFTWMEPETLVNLVNTRVEVTVTADLPESILSPFDVFSDSIEVEAVAVAGELGMPLCVVALNPFETKAIEASGGTSFVAPTCTVHVNSSDVGAVNFSGGSTLESGGNCFVGGVRQGYDRMIPPPAEQCSPIADPFADVQMPDVGPCDHTEEVRVAGAGTHELFPGVYCGGINVSSVDNAYFHPGIYVIFGEFRSTGGSPMEGEGVSFVMTGEDAGLTWSGGGVYKFSAPTSGPMQSMLVYGDRDAQVAEKSHLSGGANSYYEGNIYLPNQELIVSGGGETFTPSPYTSLVADTITYSGGSQLRIAIDPTLASVPVSRQLYGGAGSGGVRLVE